MMAVTFSRTILRMSKKSSPSTQVTQYCLSRLGFCRHMPINWVQYWPRYGGRMPCHQIILQIDQTWFNRWRQVGRRAGDVVLGPGAPSFSGSR